MAAVTLAPTSADAAYDFTVTKYSDGVPPDGTPEWSISFLCVPGTLSLPAGLAVTVDDVITQIAQAVKAATGIVQVTAVKCAVSTTTIFDQNDGT